MTTLQEKIAVATVVAWDLDETLIHTIQHDPDVLADLAAQQIIPAHDGVCDGVVFFFRPGLKTLLDLFSAEHTHCLFTKADPTYAATAAALLQITFGIQFATIFDNSNWSEQKVRCGYAWETIKSLKRPQLVADTFQVPLTQILFIDDRNDVQDRIPPLFHRVKPWVVHDLADDSDQEYNVC